MTPAEESKMHEEFEAEMSGKLNLAGRQATTSWLYESGLAQIAWVAWQAAYSLRAVPEETLLNAQRYEELREHLVDCTRSDDGTTWFCSLSGDELDSEIDASIASMSASPSGKAGEKT